MNTPLPPLPGSWSALTWQQLCQMWSVKQRYGGNADVAGAAALLALALGDGCRVSRYKCDERTGEQLYILKPETGDSPMKPETYVLTARELSHIARQALRWFDYPYGDPGEKEQTDDQGNVVRKGRDARRGYVSGMRDAMILPEDTVAVGRMRFSLPQAACNNLTWQQYRSLQVIAPQLFTDGIGEEDALRLQAQFLAHVLTPRSVALLDTAGGSIRLRPHYEYRYNSEQAEGLVRFWEKRLVSSFKVQVSSKARRSKPETSASTLFHICFQTYQTALAYYAASYPLLFEGSGKNDPLRDALTGEVGTVNTIMKYAGYAEQQQVYDSNLPFVLDILNTMTKEAKEIEKMNSKIKRK